LVFSFTGNTSPEMASVGIIRARSGAIYSKITVFQFLKNELKTVLGEIERFNKLINATQDNLILNSGLLPKASESTFRDAFDKLASDFDNLKAYIEIRAEMEKFADKMINRLECLKA
jgi:hypothetical protein